MAPPKEKTHNSQVTFKQEWVPLDDPRLDFSDTRPLDQKHVASLELRMRAQGFDHLHPIPCYFAEDGKIRNYGGSHRYAAAKLSGVPQILLSIRSHAPSSPAERMSLAIGDNFHLASGENQGKMAFRMLREIRVSGEPLPKATQLAKLLNGITEQYADSLTRAFRAASDATIERYISDKKFTLAKLLKFVEQTKPVQTERIAKNDYSPPKEYRPIITGDIAKTLSVIVPLFGERGEALLQWLTSEDAKTSISGRDALIAETVSSAPLVDVPSE